MELANRLATVQTQQGAWGRGRRKATWKRFYGLEQNVFLWSSWWWHLSVPTPFSVLLKGIVKMETGGFQQHYSLESLVVLCFAATHKGRNRQRQRIHTIINGMERQRINVLFKVRNCIQLSSRGGGIHSVSLKGYSTSELSQCTWQEYLIAPYYSADDNIITQGGRSTCVFTQALKPRLTLKSLVQIVDSWVKTSITVYSTVKEPLRLATTITTTTL